MCAPPEGTLCAETDSARAESPQCEFVQESLLHDWEFASDSRFRSVFGHHSAEPAYQFQT